MYIINASNCIACGACESLCPVGAAGTNGGTYVINQDTCINCGTCAAGCPMNAIEEN